LIKVTDVGGNEKYLNSDLIEKIELIPDTLLVLVNGHNFIIKESAEEIIERIIDFKKRCNESLKSVDGILIENDNQSGEELVDSQEIL
jgi:flagellar protein FlbD